MFEYPLDLEAIVMTALARDPSTTYPSARDMKRDLQAWLRVHRKTGAPSVIAELGHPHVSSRRPATGLARLHGARRARRLLPPRIPRTISTDIVPVAPWDPAPSPPAPRAAPRPRSRVPVMAAIACVFAGS